MQASNPAKMLATAMRPLGVAFAAELEFSRSGGAVTWSFCGQRVRVAETASGACATFLAAPATDAVTGAPCALAYARGRSVYALDGDGAERLVADIREFFSGAREPAFAFTGIE